LALRAFRKGGAASYQQPPLESEVHQCLDEVDGFLQDRRGAMSGWDVTLVNLDGGSSNENVRLLAVATRQFEFDIER
jgi:hypothetical protein